MNNEQQTDRQKMNASKDAAMRLLLSHESTIDAARELCSLRCITLEQLAERLEVAARIIRETL
jgi:hypothetical protein